MNQRKGERYGWTIGFLAGFIWLPILSCLWFVQGRYFHAVAVPWEYPRASARFHMGIAGYDARAADRTPLGLVGDWEKFLGYVEEDHLSKLRQATRMGRPAGDERFVEKIEKLTPAGS